MNILSHSDAINKSSLTLALVGDAVFSLFVRSKITLIYDYKSGVMSKIASEYVNAVSQSKMLDFIWDNLTEHEQDVARRGKNASIKTKAKCADMADYKKATALEAVFGYLHLMGQYDRLNQLQQNCYDFMFDDIDKKYSLK